jgi:hypothetical protein
MNEQIKNVDDDSDIQAALEEFIADRRHLDFDDEVPIINAGSWCICCTTKFLSAQSLCISPIWN